MPRPQAADDVPVVSAEEPASGPVADSGAGSSGCVAGEWSGVCRSVARWSGGGLWALAAGRDRKTTGLAVCRETATTLSRGSFSFEVPRVEAADKAVGAAMETWQFPAVRLVQPAIHESKPELSVSSDGTMAINAASGAQEFYATDEVVRRANERLRGIGSAVTLVFQPWHTVTLDLASGGRRLVRVVAEFADGLPPAPSRDFATAVLGGRPGLATVRRSGSVRSVVRPVTDGLRGAGGDASMDASDWEAGSGRGGEGYAVPKDFEPVRTGINGYRLVSVVAESEDGLAQITLANDSHRVELASASAKAVIENVKHYAGRLGELRDRLGRAAWAGDPGRRPQDGVGRCAGRCGAAASPTDRTARRLRTVQERARGRQRAPGAARPRAAIRQAVVGISAVRPRQHPERARQVGPARARGARLRCADGCGWRPACGGVG